MNTKKTTMLEGILMTQLRVGSCAYIFTKGHLIRTSRVVAIHNQDADAIRFETLNTQYTLFLAPAPQTAAASVMTRLAA